MVSQFIYAKRANAYREIRFTFKACAFSVKKRDSPQGKGIQKEPHPKEMNEADFQNLEHDVSRHEDDLTRMQKELSEATKSVTELKQIIHDLVAGLEALDKFSADPNGNYTTTGKIHVPVWKTQLKKIVDAVQKEDAP